MDRQQVPPMNPTESIQPAMQSQHMTALLETLAVINKAQAVATEATNRLAAANSVDVYRNATDFLSKYVADQKEAIGKSKDLVLEYARDVNAESNRKDKARKDKYLQDEKNLIAWRKAMEEDLANERKEEEDKQQEQADYLDGEKHDLEALRIKLNNRETSLAQREAELSAEQLKFDARLDTIKDIRKAFLGDITETFKVATDERRLRDKIDQLEQDKSDLDTRTHDLQERIALVQAENANLKGLPEEKAELQKALAFSEANLAILERDKGTLSKDKETIQKQANLLDGQNKTLLEERSKLRQDLTSSEGQITALRSQNEALSKDKETIQKQLDLQDSQKKTLIEEKSKLRQDLTSSEGQITALRSQNEALSKDKETVQAHADLQDSQNKTLHEEKSKLRQDLTSSEGQITTLQSQNEALSKDKETVQKQADLLDGQNKTLRQDVSRLESTNKTLLKKKTMLENHVSFIEGQVSTLTKIQARLQAEIRTLSEASTTQRSHITGLQNQIKDLGHQLGQNRALLDTRSEEIKKLEQDKGEWSQKLADAEADSQLKAETATELERQIAALNASAEEATKTKTESMAEFAMVQKELQKANDKVKELEHRDDPARHFTAALKELQESFKSTKVPPPPPTPLSGQSTETSSPSTSLNEPPPRKRRRDSSPERPKGHHDSQGQKDVFLKEILDDLTEMRLNVNLVVIPLPKVLNHLRVIWENPQARAHWKHYIQTSLASRSNQANIWHCFTHLARSGHGPDTRRDNTKPCSGTPDAHPPGKECLLVKSTPKLTTFAVVAVGGIDSGN